MALFKQALLEATINKYEKELAVCDEDASFSKRHEKAMKRILKSTSIFSSVSHKKVSSKKCLIAALIAAIILLFGGLTVYAKRDAIIHFVEQIFEKFTKVSYHEEPNAETDIPDTIEKEYVPTYIPDGYELQEYVSDLTAIRVKWMNSSGEIIQFEQSIISSVYNYDNEHSSFDVLDIGEFSVYTTHDVYTDTDVHLWSYDVYSYTILINCTDDLQLEEIIQMILSMKAKE